MPRSNHTLAYIARKANVISCGIFARSFSRVDDRYTHGARFFAFAVILQREAWVGPQSGHFCITPHTTVPPYAGECLSGILFICDVEV